MRVQIGNRLRSHWHWKTWYRFGCIVGQHCHLSYVSTETSYWYKIKPNPFTALIYSFSKQLSNSTLFRHLPTCWPPLNSKNFLFSPMIPVTSQRALTRSHATRRKSSQPRAQTLLTRSGSILKWDPRSSILSLSDSSWLMCSHWIPTPSKGSIAWNWSPSLVIKASVMILLLVTGLGLRLLS